MILDKNGNPYGDATTVRRPSGYILMDDKEIAQTIQCVHGGEHFISIRGSGKTRGFCLNCSGVTCGSPQHADCLHKEKRLDLYEKGLISTLA